MLQYIEQRHTRPYMEPWQRSREAAYTELNQCIAEHPLAVDEETMGNLRAEISKKLADCHDDIVEYADHVRGLYKRAMMYWHRETILHAMTAIFDEAMHPHLRIRFLNQEETVAFLKRKARIRMSRHTLGAYEIDHNPQGKYPPQGLVISVDEDILAAICTPVTTEPRLYGLFMQSLRGLNYMLDANSRPIIDNLIFVTPEIPSNQWKTLRRKQFIPLVNDIARLAT